MANLFPPRHVYFPSISQHTCTVIFLHEHRSNGPDLAAELAASRFSMSSSDGDDQKNIFGYLPSIRWVFPSARARYFYWSQEQQFRGEDNLPEWFHLADSSDHDSDKQVSGLRESVPYILRIVDEEVHRLNGSAEKVFLGGVGQGAAVGLVALLCTQQKLGGFVGAMGWMPFEGIISSLLDKGDVEQAGNYMRKILLEPNASQQQQWALPLFSGDADPQKPGTELSHVDVVSAAPIHTDIPAILIYDQMNDTVDVKVDKTAYDVLQRLGFDKVSMKAVKRENDKIKALSQNRVIFARSLSDIAKFLGDNQSSKL